MIFYVLLWGGNRFQIYSPIEMWVLAKLDAQQSILFDKTTEIYMTSSQYVQKFCDIIQIKKIYQLTVNLSLSNANFGSLFLLSAGYSREG